MMSLWDALRMNMMISYQELVRTFLSSWSGLIFLIPKMVCHLCIESGFNAELFQQPIKLTEVFRGFEVFGQFVARACNCFSSIN